MRRRKDTRERLLRRARQRRHRERKIALAYERCGGAKCATCGKGPEAGLEFHHVDPRAKTTELTRLWSYGQKFLDECELCEVVCHECHKAGHRRQKANPLPPLEEAPF